MVCWRCWAINPVNFVLYPDCLIHEKIHEHTRTLLQVHDLAGDETFAGKTTKARFCQTKASHGLRLICFRVMFIYIAPCVQFRGRGCGVVSGRRLQWDAARVHAVTHSLCCPTASYASFLSMQHLLIATPSLHDHQCVYHSNQQLWPLDLTSHMTPPSFACYI